MQGIDTQTLQAVRNRYLGQVATRCIQPDAIDTTNKVQQSRFAHFARDHITSLQFVLPNYYVLNRVEQGFGSTATFTASVEYPAGVFNQVLFSGVASGLAPSASILVSDPVRVNIPLGKQFWSKIWRSDLSGGILFTTRPYMKNNAGLGDGLHYGINSSFVGDHTMDATQGNDDANNIYAPIAIIGYTKRGSVLIIGDSLSAGQNDTADTTGDVGLFRYMGGNTAYINAGVPGDRIDSQLTSSTLRRSLGQYVTDIVVQTGINGIGTFTGAQVSADRQSFGNLLRAAYPNKRLWCTTLTPVTADGTNAAAGGNNAQRIAFNTLQRAIPSPFDGCLELADGVENSRNGGLFASSTYVGSADGTHLTQPGYKAIATAAFVDYSDFTV